MHSTSKEVLVSALKSGFSAVPFIGGALNEFLFEIRGRIAQQRLNNFTDSFIKSLCELGVIVDEERITSESFNDIYIAIVKRVVETNCQHKLKMFKDILIHNLQRPYESNFRETFLDLVMKLDYIEIEILNMFKDTGRSGSLDIPTGSDGTIAMLTSKSYEEVIKARIKECSPDLTSLEVEGKYEFYICDLISKSLLIDSKTTGNTWNDLEKEALTVLYITDFGKEFLNFIYAHFNI